MSRVENMKKLRSQRTVSEMAPARRKGLNFDDFVAYKKRCLEPEKYLDEDHFFWNFDLKSHNANAEQVEKVAERKRIENETPKISKRRPARLVTRVVKSRIDQISTAPTSAHRQHNSSVQQHNKIQTEGSPDNNIKSFVNMQDAINTTSKSSVERLTAAD